MRCWFDCIVSARKNRLITGLYHLANLGALSVLEKTGALYSLFVTVLLLRGFPIFPDAGIVIGLTITSHVVARRGIGGIGRIAPMTWVTLTWLPSLQFSSLRHKLRAGTCLARAPATTATTGGSFRTGSVSMRRGIVSSAVSLLWFLLQGAILAGEDAFPKVELTASRLTVVHIKPGTIVGRKPPRQWSHLVIKSLPRLSSGDLNTLPDTALRTTALFRTVILADVKSLPQQPQRYVLRRIGVGLCAPDRQGRDVVVEPGW